MTKNYPYNDNLKQVAWRSYWEGYKLGIDVEQMKEIDKTTANTRFERMWGE